MAYSYPGDSLYREEPHCPLCLDKFKTRRQLPCLHSFCQCCLEDYVSFKAAMVKELKQFECPTCRTVVPVSLFPIKEKEDIHCDCCFSVGEFVTAKGFCVVCEEAMCDSCIKAHKKQKISKDHSIPTMEELTDNPNNIIRLQEGFRCQEHKGEDLKFYCRDHRVTCCARCCIVHHRNCGQVLDLSKNVDNFLREVNSLQVMEEMKKLEDYLMHFEEWNDSYINSLKSQVQELTNKIKEIRKTLNDLLDDIERKVNSDGNQLYTQEAIRKQEEIVNVWPC